MSLRINSEAPNFTAETTQGQDQFPPMDRRWLGDPVLASQGFHAGLHHRAGLHRPGSSREFDKRGCKVVGLSGRSGRNHARWAKDIEETQGAAVNYPMIGDPRAQGGEALRHAAGRGRATPSQGRTPADNATVRSVFVIGPDKKIKAMLTYPMATGRNFDEVLRLLDSLQLTAKHPVATPVNWKQGEDVIIVTSVTDEQAKQRFPKGFRTLKPYLRLTPQP